MSKELNEKEKDNNLENFLEFKEDKELIDLLSSIFKVLADPTRLKILYLLSMGPLNVSDITSALDMNQSSISHQLALLKNKGLIKSVRDGRMMIYSIDDEHVLTLFDEGYKHAKHKKDD